jgi:hypothetical protein
MTCLVYHASTQMNLTPMVPCGSIKGSWFVEDIGRSWTMDKNRKKLAAIAISSI